MLKGVSGAQRRKKVTRKIKPLDQNRSNRITHFKKTDTVMTVFEKMLLHFFLFQQFLGHGLNYTPEKVYSVKKANVPFCSNPQQRLQKRPYPLQIFMFMDWCTGGYRNLSEGWTAKVQAHAPFCCSANWRNWAKQRAMGTAISTNTKARSIRTWKVRALRSTLHCCQHRLPQ